MPAADTPLIHKITTWLTPGMILIISYLLKTDIDYVKEQLKGLTATNITVATMGIRLSSLEERTSILEQRSLLPNKGQGQVHVSYYYSPAKHEDSISLKHLLSKN